MNVIGTFPFGQPVTTVTQEDRNPKRVFVLGVYASAVHAQWVGLDGKDIVKTLAVASEPYIFWRGDGAEQIIKKIHLPKELGSLELPVSGFNGPSGVALDNLFLQPLGLERKDTWLCDLVSNSCVNPAQLKALKRTYFPLLEKHRLPNPSTPCVPAALADSSRRNEIMIELRKSKAKVLVLLGDMPIKWFLAHFDRRWKRLSDFTPYGTLHDAKIDGETFTVLPLVHPRQAAKLGRYSVSWFEKHAAWVKDGARRAAAYIAKAQGDEK